MGLFTTEKPKITQNEFKKILNDTYSIGNFNTHEREFVESVVGHHFDASPYDAHPGIDEQEVKEILGKIKDPHSDVMKASKIGQLPPSKIDFLEREFENKLKTNE
jgi:hypothetical protein